MNTDYISSDVARALGSRVLQRFFRVSVGEASQILDLGRRKIHLFIEQGVVVPSASAAEKDVKRNEAVAPCQDRGMGTAVPIAKYVLLHYCPVISRIKTTGYKVGLIRFGGRTS